MVTQALAGNRHSRSLFYSVIKDAKGKSSESPGMVHACDQLNHRKVQQKFGGRSDTMLRTLYGMEIPWREVGFISGPCLSLRGAFGGGSLQNRETACAL